MRVILTILLLLGVAAIVLAELEHTEELARWSNIYALFEQTGDRNPLRSKEIGERFDAIVMRDGRVRRLLFGSGALTSIVAIIGLVKLSRHA